VKFQYWLKYGTIAENQITQWLISRGAMVQPVYEMETEHAYKGPRVFAVDREFLAPDLLVFNRRGARWVEAKAKAHFTWHRMSHTWQTGIDVACYEDYLALRGRTSLELWLMFLHLDSRPDAGDLRMGSPEICPTGLYGGEIQDLAEKIHHSHKNWGKKGMVYWREPDLKQIATAESFLRAIRWHPQKELESRKVSAA
jgi:hypothetical protein